MSEGRTPTNHALERNGESRFTRRALIVVGIAAAAVVVMLFFWVAAPTLLFIFAGVLFSEFLRMFADLLRRHLFIPPGWSLVIVLVLFTGVIVAVGWLLGTRMGAQFDALSRNLVSSWERLVALSERYEWSRMLASYLTSIDPAQLGGIRRFAGVFSNTLGGVANVVLILFVGIYVAANPALYRSGLLRMVALHRRRRASEVMAELSQTLRGWLFGQMFSMVVVGASTALGLWLLGVPLALPLGTIAFALTFIPYLGPLLSAIPALLVALSVGTSTVLYVALLYMGVQAMESYLLTPIVQKRQAHLPPALTVSVQVVAGALMGLPGILLATPLAACALVLVKMLYVEDVLGDSMEEPIAGAEDDGR